MRTSLRRRGDVTCLLCGTSVGEVLQGRFVHHSGCERPIRWRGRLPRCCRCGGSLYFDPVLWVSSFAGADESERTLGARGQEG